MRNSVAFLVSVIAVLLGLGLAALVDDGAYRVAGLPLLAALALFGFVVQWLVFVPSFLRQTEHYYDLTGALTYASVILLAAGFGSPDARGWVLAALVLIWCGRLGGFLFLRVKRSGKDGRFDTLKPYCARFFMAWTLQGLWVFLTLSAALASMTGAHREPLGLLAWVGIWTWLAGFAVEAVADAQKRRFRRDPANEGRFITSGLWAWSRHPNYFGEIVLWIGIALIASEVLSGWQWVTMVSPLFVILLLTRISGVPLLEAQAKRRWGDDPEYRAWRARTATLVPRPPRDP